MARHLSACPRRIEAAMAADEKPGDDTQLYHLQARDTWRGDYWLDLEVRGSATLKQLDRYLRAIWLECCGHLSQFSIGGWLGGEIGMTRRIDRALAPDVELTHIYDFGTETVTLVRGVDARVGKPTTRHPIALMARNNPPDDKCMECDQPASWLCIECIYEDDTSGTLCANHVESHPHGDYGDPLPVVNSPRQGSCGYDGPALPPY